MTSILSSALSGLAAAQKRLEVSARNIANISSTGPLAGAPPDVVAAFAALRMDQTEAPGGGTVATVSKASPATVAVADPTSRFANADGMVAAPNVDLANEAVQTLVARYSFAANAAVLRADNAMRKSLLDIKT